MAMKIKHCVLAVFVLVAAGCKAQQPAELKKPEPTVILKPKYALLTAEQRKQLGFPADLIAGVELAAGAEAEPFFATVLRRTENLKGDTGFESQKLAGFSVHAKKGDELIDRFHSGLRVKGFLIFKSHRGVYKNLPDVVTVIKGGTSYDILKTQMTEAPNYHLSTASIIAWLKGQQKLAPFTVVGAGPDWVEARFIHSPKNMNQFARKAIAFAPDVLTHGPRDAEQYVERMKRSNGFLLLWD